MKKFYTVGLVLFLILAFGAVCFQACAQTTPLSFPPVLTDLNRPMAGFNEWSYDQNIINIPTQGTNTQRLDRYWRFTWLDFQPFNGTSGVYNFTAFDQKIQQSITKGQSFSFGVMQQCGGCDASLQGNVSGNVMLYPLWLHTQMQSGSPTDFTSGGEWFPYYNSPFYLTALKNLNIAINNHILNGSFNGIAYKTVIGQIDIRGYGDFGEWTNNVFTGGAATTATLDSIISFHVHVFDKFQCLEMIAANDGNQLSNTMVPPAVGFYALNASNSIGRLGLRRDSWGQTDSYLDQWMGSNPTVVSGYHFDSAINNRYKYAPVCGEPQDGGSAGNFPQLPSQMHQYGVTSVGNGNFNNAINATIQNNFRAASALAGYKYTILSGNLSGNLLTLTWSNINTAPTYLGWKVMLELRSGSTVLWSKQSKAVLKGLLGNITTVDSLPNGSGDLYLIIRDPVAYRKPMPLAVIGQNADGSYLLKSGITISGSGTIPTPPVDTTVIPNPPVDTTKPTPPDTTHPVPPANCDTTIKVPVKTPVYTPRTVIDTTYTTTFKDSVIHRTCGGTIPPVTTTTTVFTTQVPTGSAERDNTTGIEVGMKFTSSVAGSIIGVRFYKQSGNSGTHTGELYSSTGTRLASAVYQNETASGWQVVLFSNPVPITAQTSYVAACFSSAGSYTSDNSFSKPVVNGPLTATQGVYKYTGTPALPGSTYQQSNYWVDAVYAK